MSSNPSLHITRSNYEEYFFLYIDNELSAADRAAVDAFAALHPDLGEELSLLQETTLAPEPLSFDHSFLLAPGIAATALEEDLLSYIDNELPQAERLRLETLLAGDATLRESLAGWQATKLDAADAVPCPFKADLYRETPVERRAFGWWRVAAAVLLLAGGSALYLTLGGKASNTDTPGAFAPTGTATPAAGHASLPDSVDDHIPSRATVALTDMSKPVPTAAGGTHKKARQAQPLQARPVAPADAMAARVKTVPQQSPAPNVVLPPTANEVAVAVAVAGRPAQSLPERINSIESAPRKEIINSTPVTGAAVSPYTTQTIALADVPAGGKGGSVRGFLRKATRFIERRTGIKATNADDQLLLGAVAINLK